MSRIQGVPKGSGVEYWTSDPEVQGSNPWRVQGRILDFGSRGPGFESLGHRSVGPHPRPGLGRKPGTDTGMGSAAGWDGWDTSQPIYSLFNTSPMGAAWKESTPEGLRPPQYSEGGGAPGYRISPRGGRPVMDWCLNFECY